MPPTEANLGASPAPQAEPSPTWGAAIREFVLYVAVAAAILLPFRAFIAKPYIVNGASMSPTFETGDYLIIDEISYELREPRRGEVAVFKFPEDTSKSFIKRVIGVPGDTVTIADGKVSIKPAAGEAFDVAEPYVKIPSRVSGVYVLKDGEYFAMGDNRLGSYDSRAWGPVPRSDFIGRAVAELLPVSKIGLFPGDASAAK